MNDIVLTVSDSLTNTMNENKQIEELHAKDKSCKHCTLLRNRYVPSFVFLFFFK